MSQQASAPKPSLSGVRIKARKGAVKAQAKHEPAVFRDQLYKHLETVPEGDFDGYYNKLVQAGSTLEFLKYADAFYEIYFAGGLLQPGGDPVQDGAPPSPFSIATAKEPAEIDGLKKYVDVLNKLIRRYKYLQKPLEDQSLPGLVQYVGRWEPSHRDKFALTVGLLMSQGITTGVFLQNLAKDNLVKDNMALNVVTIIFRAYLADQSMDQLASLLRKAGIRDLSVFAAANKRDAKTIEQHFRKANLPAVADWYSRRQAAVARESVVKVLKDLREDEEKTNEELIDTLKEKQAELGIPDTDFVTTIWPGFMGVIDWNTRPDQLEANVLREVDKFAPVLEPFCESGKAQIALINAAQVYCYDEARAMKMFPQLLKILYNKDCISAQAIIYWYQKGAKPQGKQHFLKATEALVEFLQDQSYESDEED